MAQRKRNKARTLRKKAFGGGLASLVAAGVAYGMHLAGVGIPFDLALQAVLAVAGFAAVFTPSSWDEAIEKADDAFRDTLGNGEQ